MDGLWTLYLDKVVSPAATPGPLPTREREAQALRLDRRMDAVDLALLRRAGTVETDPVNAIRAWLPEFTALRGDLHAHPETGFDVHRTAAIVAEKLAAWGIEVHRGIGRTGVVGVLRNGPGPRIGLRAEMDALEMTEANGFVHASRIAGRMHACGHDGHTAMLLAAARYLATTRRFQGTVVFIFQPAEEGQGGARAMLDDGLFTRFPCDRIYALHNWPGIPIGHFGVSTGPVMAGSAFFDITIRGRGGHGARPGGTIDPVAVGAEMIGALQAGIARHAPARDAVVLSVTGFDAGRAYNVIPESASLRGTVRAFSDAVLRLAEARIRSIAHGVACAHGAMADACFREVTRPVVNAEIPGNIAAAAAIGLVGASRVARDLPPSAIGEDFATMLDAVPGAFVLVGNGENAAELHTPRYDFNDAAIPYGAGLLAAVTERELRADA